MVVPLFSGALLFAQDSSVTVKRQRALVNEYKDAQSVIDLWNKETDNSKTSNALKMEEMAFLLQFYNDISEKTEDTLSQRLLKFPLALSYHSLTRYDKALPILEDIVEKPQDYNEKDYGDILVSLEEEYRAIGDFKNAIALRRKRINLNYVNTLHDLYKDVGLFDLAIDDYENLEIKPENNPFQLMLYHKSLGNLYLEAKLCDSAKLQFNEGIKALKPILKTNDYPGKTGYSEYTKYYYLNYLKGNIASCDVVGNFSSDVIPIIKKDIATSRTIREVDNRIVKWLVLADLYIAREYLDSAKTVLDSVALMMKNKRMLPSELKFLKLQGEYYRGIGKTDEALTYLDEYVKFSDSIDYINAKNQSVMLLATLDNSTQKNTVRQQRLELERQQVKREYEELRVLVAIIILVALLLLVILAARSYIFRTKARDKIKQQNEQLLQKNKENELLLREVHHRVKNNLQTISSLLGLQSHSVEDEKVKLAFLEGQNRVHSMALIHKRLYESEHLGAVDFKDYVSQLSHNLINSFGKGNIVEYTIDSTVNLSIEKAVPLGLIVNELITNVLKYGASSSGHVCFEMSMTENKENNKFHLRDFGQGFDVDAAREKNSLGLKLITLLSRQLDGKLSYNSNSSGTAYNLEFPKK